MRSPFLSVSRKRSLTKDELLRKISLLFITIERLRIKFTSNGKHEFVPHDQVSSLYLSFTVHYFYTLIRSFMQFFSD